VEDAVRAILLGMRRGFGAGPIQIGPGYCTSIREIAETLVRISGKKIRIQYDRTRPEGDQSRCADFRKARRVLGWSPRVGLEEGLGDLLAWVQNQIRQGARKDDLPVD
jgi:GDP-D-mannose 3',5'-epimerase